MPELPRRDVGRVEVVPDRDPLESVAFDLLQSAPQFLRGRVLDAGVHAELHEPGPYARRTYSCPMAPLLDVDTWPELRDPVMRGHALRLDRRGHGRRRRGRGAHRAARSEARSSGASTSPTCMDLQQTRPTVHLVDGVSREITWPSIDFVAGRSGRDVVVCVGPEPSLRWRAVLGEIVDAAQRLGVSSAFTLGGIPSVASHRRPVEVLATGTSEDVVAEIGALAQRLHRARPARRARCRCSSARPACPRSRCGRRSRTTSPPARRRRRSGRCSPGSATSAGSDRPLDPRRPGAGLHPACRRGHRGSSRRRRGHPRDRVGHRATAPERRRACVRDRTLSPRSALRSVRSPAGGGGPAGRGRVGPAGPPGFVE